MKRINLFAAAMLMLCAAACEKSEPVENEQESGVIATEPEWEDTVVTISFARIYTEPMTSRTRSTELASIINRLDVWIVDEAENVIDFHQSKTDADFGVIAATLNKTKTYTLYAMAHKCDAAATLADGIISFPDDKVTHSLYYTTTFSPATTTTINAEMKRIVGMFRIEPTDIVPDAAKKMRFTISDVYDKWSVDDGPNHKLDRVSTINITSKNPDGTASFSIYAIVPSAETTHTVTIEALDADDAPVQTALVLEGVKMKAGYKTIYRGTFFTDKSFSITMTAEEWSEYDVVNF